jgi:hypothetical protein
MGAVRRLINIEIEHISFFSVTSSFLKRSMCTCITVWWRFHRKSTAGKEKISMWVGQKKAEKGDLEDGGVEAELLEDGLPEGGDGGPVVVVVGAVLGHLVAD